MSYMISIIIRTLNEAYNLERCLKILELQDVEHEIIVIDSYSTDDTLKIAQDYNCKTLQCLPFTYGRGINMGIANSSAELICILSGHAFPISTNFISGLSIHFADASVAGVYCRQLPSINTSDLDKRNLPLIFKSSDKIIEDISYFNNAASMIRKSIWERIKFDENKKASEDILWASEVRRLGFKIIYNPFLMVEHFHGESNPVTVERYLKEL